MKTLKILTGMIMVVLVSFWGCSSMVLEKAADAPGNTALSESFPPFPSTF